MTAPAKLPLSKKELFYAKKMARGHLDWGELSYEEKKMMYETPIDLSDRVSDEQIDSLETEMAIRGEFGPAAVGKAAVTKAASRLKSIRQ